MNENRSTTEFNSDEQLPDLDAEPPEPQLQIHIADEQSTLKIDPQQLEAAVQQVFNDSAYQSCAVSIAVVDDPTIHEINRQYLDHDYPTDVLSFVLEDRPPYLEGQLVVSTDTAKHNAAEYGWLPESELLLYILHGALHLVGYRDKQPDEIEAMHTAEVKHLRQLGIEIPAGSSRWSVTESCSGISTQQTDEEVPSR